MKKQDNSKIVLIEGMSPRGHTQFNKYYIKSLSPYINKVYVGESLFNSYKNLAKVSFFDDKHLFKYRLVISISFLINTLKIIYKSKKNGTKYIILLSYDVSSLFIVVYFSKLFNMKLFVFEHNTVPTKGMHKKILQFICFDWVHRICYTPRAVEIYKSLNQKSKYIPLPIPIKEDFENKLNKSLTLNNKEFDFVVFCPSSSASMNKVIEKAELYKNILFIIKTKIIINLDNVVTKQYFENYEDIIESVDFFYLPVSLDSRVSGPFFEAIGAGKKVILSKGYFYDYAKKEFKQYILCDEDDWNFSTSKMVEMDIDKYNTDIINNIKKYILDEN